MIPKPKKEPSSSHARSKCDGLLYQCLLRRDVVCQRCGSSDNLVPSHCYGKGTWPSLRHVLLNNLLFCNDCHVWWHANIHDSWIWFVNTYRERYDYLVIEKNQYVKLNKQHYQDTAIELEAELKRLKREGK